MSSEELSDDGFTVVEIGLKADAGFFLLCFSLALSSSFIKDFLIVGSLNP